MDKQIPKGKRWEIRTCGVPQTEFLPNVQPTPAEAQGMKCLVWKAGTCWFQSVSGQQEVQKHVGEVHCQQYYHQQGKVAAEFRTAQGEMCIHRISSSLCFGKHPNKINKMEFLYTLFHMLLRNCGIKATFTLSSSCVSHYMLRAWCQAPAQGMLWLVLSLLDRVSRNRLNFPALTTNQNSTRGCLVFVKHFNVCLSMQLLKIDCINFFLTR